MSETNSPANRLRFVTGSRGSFFICKKRHSAQLPLDIISCTAYNNDITERKEVNGMSKETEIRIQKWFLAIGGFLYGLGTFGSFLRSLF